MEAATDAGYGERPGQTPSALSIAQAVLRCPGGALAPARVVRGSNPSFLLPLDRSVASRMCRSYNLLRPPRRRIERSLLALAIRVGLIEIVTSRAPDLQTSFDTLPPHRSLLDELGDRLGTELQVGVGLGSLDTWWKPVLQLFDSAGDPVAFAKVGWNDVTSSLVSNEGATLRAIVDHVVDPIVPRPLEVFRWGPLTVAVTAPLPLGCRRLDGASIPAPPRAMTAALGTTDIQLVRSGWWVQQREAIESAPEGQGVDMERLRSLADVVEQRFGHREVELGLLHGDWVPWNLARTENGQLVAWDWEYAHLNAPTGLDHVHGTYQASRLTGGQTDRDAFGRAHAGVPRLQSSLHAVMVAARRCAAASTGVSDQRGRSELKASIGALAAALEEQ